MRYDRWSLGIPTYRPALFVAADDKPRMCHTMHAAVINRVGRLHKVSPMRDNAQTGLRGTGLATSLAES